MHRKLLRFAILWTAPALFAQDTPQWQIAAGGKMAFEVASIKPDQGPFVPPNFPLDNGDVYTQTDGRFSAGFPLIAYIQFAYKIRMMPGQVQTMLAALPKWIASDRFSIQAKAESKDPTKDQMRLMMQSLLEDRFQLKVHFETRETPVLALTLLKPGKPGPKLRPHSEGPPCDAPPPSGVFPAQCDLQAMALRPGQLALAGSRHTTMELLAAMLPSLGALDRPVIDQTGIDGRVDFTLEWVRESMDPTPPTARLPDQEGPTFLQALQDQLGMKLESTKAPLRILVIDHVEQPSEN